LPNYPYSDFETRIARRDFRDITKDVLPTPCMVVELDRPRLRKPSRFLVLKVRGIFPPP